MPLYEYQCEACGHRFETIQKFSDPPIEACPKCGGAVHKLQSAPAFQFKGTGWYITDYAKKDSGGKTGQTPPASEKSDTASSASSSETKTDSSKSDAGSSTPAAKTGSDAKG
jgi:putative FmdB family regulatory protein